MESAEIIHFWFEEIEPKMHWVKDLSFDQMITDRFAKIHKAASLGELFSWRKSPLGRLAEVIVLDQFSRNMFRNTEQSFRYDPLALALAQEAVSIGDDQKLSLKHRHFLYMPYMHSESPLIHQEALRLFSQPGLDPEFEIKHKNIIDQFGRYPHRNAILNRASTTEEIEFLKGPNSSF